MIILRNLLTISLVALIATCAPTYAEEAAGLDEALKSLDSAIESDPYGAEAYFRRGNIYESKGSDDIALSDYNMAIDLNPRYAKAFINRGVIYYKKGELERAILDYTRALELDPSYGEAYANIGLAYKKLGRFDQALYYMTRPYTNMRMIPPYMWTAARSTTKKECGARRWPISIKRYRSTPGVRTPI